MDDDLKSASESMHHKGSQPAYAPKPSKPARQKKNIKAPLIVIGIFIVVTVGSVVAWKLLLKKHNTATPAITTASSQAKATKLTDVPDSVLLSSYDSTALSVSLKYPKDWKVTEANKGIKIESPNFFYPTVSAGEIEGNFRIYIRQGSRTVDGTYIGKGVAIKASEKLTYTQPALGQRIDTLISSFGENSRDNFSFFLIAGNFQLNPGDTLGPDYGKEPDTYIAAGGYSRSANTDDLATIPVPVEYYDSTNVYKQSKAIIASLKLN